ncbi:hypothetical protein CK203_019082 [Vitis vinifera]|uniref:DUF4283 domain-containing protein n=1 Tax=Vitis vinifera TaxID=29760 RepID=A0A438IQZ7_VITVI|nr:hypothetical protein CK203_019082 [Vitis vinifera]
MGGPLMMLEFEDEEEAKRTLKRGRLWWERLPWLSKVVSMKKMKGGEKEKAREEREVGSCTESSSSKGKEMWRVAEVEGVDSVRKDGGEEKLDGDETVGKAETLSALGKKYGGKGKGEVGLSEGVIRPEQCKSTVEVSQVHLDWALKVRKKLSGLWDCWEKGQSSGGSGRAYSEGHSSPPRFGPNGVECRPSMGLSEEQPSEALWACHSFRPTKESRLKEAKASFGRPLSVNWFEEQLLPGEMVVAAERSENGRASCADEWLMEENAMYSTLKPSTVCLWGGWVSSSSIFSGGRGGVVMAMEERCEIDTVVKESEGRLNFTPLRVCSVEERDDQMGVGISFLVEEGRDDRAEKEDDDEDSWRYSCLARFCQYLGMPAEGFEREILQLLNRIRERRDVSERVTGRKRKGQRLSKFDWELKKLE